MRYADQVKDTLDISAYRSLWDGSETGWVLLRISTKRGAVLVPFNTKRRELLELQDDEVVHHVALRMKFAGVPVWEKSSAPG